MQSLTGSEERQASILGCCVEQAGGLASSHMVRGSLSFLATSLVERKEKRGPSQHRNVLAKLRVRVSQFKVWPSFLPLPQQKKRFALPIAHSSLGNASLFPWQPIHGPFFFFRGRGFKGKNISLCIPGCPWRSTCLSLLGAGIKVGHHNQPAFPPIS